LEERLCRGRHRENKIVEDFVRAKPGGYRASARSAQGELYFEFRYKKDVKEKTLTELLNTLQYQQGVLEKKDSKRALASLRGTEGRETFEVRAVEAQGKSC
jgi:hypothetical protein